MNDAEKDGLLSLISGYAGEQLDFLTEICSVNSHSLNKAGTDTVAERILEKLTPIFPFHTVIGRADVGNHHILKTEETEGGIYLLGHMDTVFPPGHPFQRCRRDSDWLVGPGVADMKGGIAVLVFGLKALGEIGLINRLGLTVILSGDEELGSRSSKALYEEERRTARACLVFECGGRNGSIVVSRNGKAGARLLCRGKDRHVGNGTHEKSSAILELAHKVIALEALNAVYPGVSCNVGTIQGGLGPATVPAEAGVLLDIRWHDQEHYEPLLAKIELIAGTRIQADCTSDVAIVNYRPAMPRTDATDRLLRPMQHTAENLGQRLEIEHRRGTSDANFFGSFGVPALDGLGPIGEHDHTDRERILISSLVDRTALLAAFLAEHGHRFGTASSVDQNSSDQTRL
jgi:glutamate carboxypeptidase